MKETIRLAIDNVESGRGGPFGAIVVKDGELIASGTNLVIASNDPTAHAEINAIRAACQTLKSFQLTGCQVYTSCEPCPMCMGALYWARPAAYYYAATRDAAAEAGFDDVFIYRELSAVPGQRTLAAHRVLAAESRLPFVKWAANPGNRAY
jgi:guanine deaminase